MLHYVHSSLIYNSQKLERTQMPLNGGMYTQRNPVSKTPTTKQVSSLNKTITHKDTQKLWYIYTIYGIHYSAIKNNEFLKFLDKWMELENILSEVTQSQKNTHGMHSLRSGY